MALLLPRVVLDGYGGDLDGINGARESVSTCVSTVLPFACALLQRPGNSSAIISISGVYMTVWPNYSMNI